MNADEKKLNEVARAMRNAVYQQPSSDKNWESGTVRESWWATLARFETELAKLGYGIVPGVALASPGAVEESIMVTFPCGGVLPIHDGNNYLVRSGNGFVLEWADQGAPKMTTDPRSALSLGIRTAVVCAMAMVKRGMVADVVLSDIIITPSAGATIKVAEHAEDEHNGFPLTLDAAEATLERFQVRVADGWVMNDPKLAMVVTTDRDKATDLTKDEAAVVLSKLGSLGLTGVPVMVGQD